MRYTLRLSRATERALTVTLPEQIAAAVWKLVNGPLLDNPHHMGTALQFGLEGLFSARRSHYRVIYRIVEDEVVVDVVKISHRSDAYG